MFLNSFQVRGSPYQDYTYSIQDAFQCIAQGNTTLLDCILCQISSTSTIQTFYQVLQISASFRMCILDEFYQGTAGLAVCNFWLVLLFTKSPAVECRL